MAWSLLEACISEAISIQLSTDCILPLIQKLPLNGHSGKVEMAFSLDLLSRDERKFVTHFSGLRNRLAHGTSMFGFKFSEFFNDNEKRITAEKMLIFSDVTDPDTSTILTFKTDSRLLVLSNAIHVCLNVIGTARFDEDSHACDQYCD